MNEQQNRAVGIQYQIREEDLSKEILEEIILINLKMVYPKLELYQWKFG